MSGISTGQTVRTLAEGRATAEVKRRKAHVERQKLEKQTAITLAAFAGVDFFCYNGRLALDRRDYAWAQGEESSRSPEEKATPITDFCAEK
jgi:hypothetical protein